MTAQGPLDKLVGRMFGEFVLRERIGEGGFGAVYRAEQPTLDRQAVVKVLHARLNSSKVVTERFLREAKLASKLDHPYAAHVYAFGVEPDGELWIAMELVRGTSLDQILRIQGPLPLERFVPLLDRICEVVHSAHEGGIVHRDLKPANVMVLSRAGRLLPKLLDFGIAKGLEPGGDLAIAETLVAPPPLSMEQVARSETLAGAVTPSRPMLALTQQGAVMGSPAYMAPEQWLNAGQVDARTDIYALGILSYEALIGKSPFTGKTLTALAAAHAAQEPPPLGTGFPPALDKVLAKALAKAAGDRYSDTLSFASAFREAAGLGGAEPVSLPALDARRRDEAVSVAPHPIAEAVAALEAARNAHQARDAMFGLVRTIIRYLGLVALACRSRVSTSESVIVAEMLRTLHRRALTDPEWLSLTVELTRAWVTRRDAYPVPELVDAFHEPRSKIAEQIEALLALRQDGESARVEDSLIGLLEDSAKLVSELLGGLAFVSQYPLVLVIASGVAERWMGVRRAQRTTVTVHGKTVAPGVVALLDPDGIPILALGPLFQVAAPTPGAPVELFMFDGRDRRGAKLVAHPLGFEHHDDGLWDWFRAQLSGSLDDNDAAAAEERAPYRGLSSFSSDDGTMFFGREKLVDSFMNRLRVQPLLTVVGRSGSGKSSFVHAGVIPALPAGWRSVAMRPGSAPLAVLEARLQHVGIEAKGLASGLEHDRGLLGVLLRSDASAHGPLLLVIDQLEELFTLCPSADERRIFAEALAETARTPDDPIRVVFTLRDDFLVRTEQLPAFSNRIGQSLQLVTVPQPEDLLRILIEPVRRVGYDLEDPQLPIEMVREVADQPGALALLSFTAAKLWELRDRHFKQLTRKAYRSLGGVGGALARHAEQTLADMMAEEQHLTRESFRHLVTTQNTRAVLARSELRQLLGDNRHADAVIEKLVAARLLVASENETGAETIEIVHEALLGAWPRLVEWRREDIDGARLREQLRTTAKQWEDRKRPKGLLWRGDALADYTRWRTRHPGPLTDEEHAFATASLGDATRGRRIRRGLVAAAFAVLGAGLLVLTTLNAKKEEEREKAAEAQARAQTSERRALEDHGRQLLLDGDPIRAAIYLDAAKQAGASSPALSYMLDRSLAVLQKRKRVFKGHQKTVQGGLYGRDGHQAFTFGDDHAARAWDTATGQLLVTYTGHSEAVLDLALSPDKSQLATASVDGTARLWDVKSGRALQTLRHKGWVNALRFSPGGGTLATAGDDKTVRIWDVATGAQLGIFEGHQDRVLDLRFTKDGSQLVTLGADRALVVWDVRTHARARVLDDHADPGRGLSMSADGQLLASGGEKNAVTIWDLGAGVRRHNLELLGVSTQVVFFGTRLVRSVFSPDTRWLVTLSGREAMVWDVSTGALRFVLRGHTADLTSVVFSSDGARIASSSSDGSVRVWDAHLGELLSIIPSTQAILWVTFSPDGRELLIGGLSGVVETWSTESDGLVGRLTGLKERGMSIVIRPDRGRVAACGENGAIRVWDVKHEHPVHALDHGAFCVVAYNRTGTRLVTGGDDGHLRLWDPDGAKIGTLHREVVARVDSVAASRDQIVAGSSDGQVQIWDLATGTISKSFVGHSLAVYAVAWGPNGTIASCGRDASARIWDVKTGVATRVLELDGPCVAVSFDGSRVVTATNQHAQIWSADRSPPVALEGHQRFVTGVMFALNGLVVTTSDDATVRVWDLTGRLLDTLRFPLPIASLDIVDSMMVVVSGEVGYVWRFPVAQRGHQHLIERLPFSLEHGLLIPREVH